MIFNSLCFSLASQPVFIPDFGAISGQDNSSDSPLATLKAKAEYAKPIGIVRCGKEELIVIYDGEPLATTLCLHNNVRFCFRIRVLRHKTCCTNTEIRLRSMGN